MLDPVDPPQGQDPLLCGSRVNVNVQLVREKYVHEEDDCRCEEDVAYNADHVIPPYTSTRMIATVLG